VDHGRGPVFGEHSGETAAIGGVTGHYLDIGVQVLLDGAACPAEQHQTPYTVRGDQMPGHQPTERARATCDEHSSVRVQCSCLRQGGTDHPGDVHLARADRELWFSDGLDAHECGHGRFLVVDVDQHQPVRVLHLCRTHQTPQGRGVEVCNVLSRPDGHRAPSDDDHPGILLRQQVLHDRKRTAQENRGERRRGRCRLAVTGERLPVHSEQRIPQGSARCPDLVRRHRAGQHRTDRRHGLARFVGNRDRHGVCSGPGQPDSHHGRCGSVQGNRIPGERQARLGRTCQQDTQSQRV
jgi:hypothetical protein